MKKKEVLASIIALANDFDEQGLFAQADSLTEVGRRLAQYDDYGFDDFDQDRYERDYNVWEERELARDEWLERQNDYAEDAPYTDAEDAISAIREQQANNGNVPYVLLIDRDDEWDDRNDRYGFLTLERWQDENSRLDFVREIPPGTQEELAPYMRDFETETPLGVELDGGFDDFGSFD